MILTNILYLYTYWYHVINSRICVERAGILDGS